MTGFDHELARLSAGAIECGAGDTVKQAEALNLARAYLDLHARHLDLLARCEQAETTLTFVREECKSASKICATNVRYRASPA